MKKQAIPTIAPPVVQPRRSFRWLDSLMWLAIAGTLATLLVPARFKQTTGKAADGNGAAVTATRDATKAADGQQYFPSGHEFTLQKEEDLLSSAKNQPPAPGAKPEAQGAAENAVDDAPRVSSGPTLNGPELGNPVPR
jgi:hypothetical protein